MRSGASLAKVERELGDVRHRVSSRERHSANLQSDTANIPLRLDHQGERLDRTEHRLEFVDQRPARREYLEP